MPKWGQLGCNGFIILDGSHSVVCSATRAFLKVKEAAFRHTEMILSALIDQERNNKPSAKLQSEKGDDASDCEDCPCANIKFGDDDHDDDIEIKEEVKDNDNDKSNENESEPQKVASVKVAVLDEEHERCEAALVRLREERSTEALKEVLSAYEDHFAHEESLLDEFLYADIHAANAKGKDQPKSFSADEGARTSHFADHEAMLETLRKLLDQPAVSVAEAKQLAKDFERHATAYDGAYADRLSSAMTAASSLVV